MHLRALNKIVYFHLIELSISGWGCIITTNEQNITKQHLRMTIGGGFKYFFYFHPYLGKKITHFDEHIFSDGLVQPPTSQDDV